MIRLAFSTNAFKKNTLPEAVEAIAEIGYRGVELMADVPHAHPSAMDEQAVVQTKALLHRLGLTVSNINAFTHFADGDTYHPTWIEQDPSRRQVRIDHTIRCIELASQFGSPTVSLQPGGPLIGSGLSRQQAGTRFADALRKVMPVAEKHQITLAIEPEPGLFIETAGEYRQFKQTFFADQPLVKMNCDIGHLFCVGDNPVDVIKSMPDQIAHVHLEDIGANRVHQHLTPGDGVIDFKSIFEALESIHYTEWVTVELYPFVTTAAGVAKRAYQHLSRILSNPSYGMAATGDALGREFSTPRSDEAV